jgi:hypothetical protein
MEDTIGAERSPTCGMERKHRLVGQLVFSFLFATESLLQRRRTTLSYRNSSLCENDRAERYPRWKAGDSL